MLWSMSHVFRFRFCDVAVVLWLWLLCCDIVVVIMRCFWCCPVIPRCCVYVIVAVLVCCNPAMFCYFR